jgi:hypothetical protein
MSMLQGLQSPVARYCVVLSPPSGLPHVWGRLLGLHAGVEVLNVSGCM